jgi:hypothetical protein
MGVPMGMDDFKEHFLAERARALATVIHTRRGDPTATEPRPGSGLDLHVYIDRADRPMWLTLGVLLRAAFASVTADQANKLLGPTVGQFLRLGKFTYPFCLFYFTMRDEQASFSWLAEPVVTEDGAPKLVHPKKADCVELTDEVLGRVVDRVVAWYNALEAVLTACGAGGRVHPARKSRSIGG